MLVAFLGTHVPLLTLLVFFMIRNPLPMAQTWTVLIIALLATLTGTGLTLFALHHLLSPVNFVTNALQDYLSNNTVPYLPVSFQDAVGVLMANTGITLRKLDRTLKHMANYDELTGLPNATHLRLLLQQLLQEARTRQRQIGMLALRIEGWEDINTTWGSAARDRLIRKVGQRLATLLTETDLLARIATDTFAVVRSDLYSPEGLEVLAQVLIQSFAQPIIIETSPVYVGVSVGISLFPDNGSTPEHLIQSAEAALQQSHVDGRNQYRFFSPEIRQLSQERLTLERDLRQAIEQEQLFLTYQPRIDLKTGQVVGAEALIRWQHPHLGLVSPARFIPIAEESGLILPIGEWVLRQACRQSYLWKQAGFAPLRMAINVSAVQFQQQSLGQVLQVILQETHLTPREVELELTESTVIGDVQRSIDTLRGLREMGSTIALDDFGTGYSSLSYLSRMPFDILKIDQSFVRSMTEQPESLAIVEAIVALAKSLKLRITAEGVETLAHLRTLVALGCDEAQGYFIARPLSVAQMTEFLKKPPTPMPRG
ncbi:MAG: hypothetical protein OHK0012_17800 [Synechococcales cyanobacterium]